MQTRHAPIVAAVTEPSRWSKPDPRLPTRYRCYPRCPLRHTPNMPQAPSIGPWVLPAAAEPVLHLTRRPGGPFQPRPDARAVPNGGSGGSVLRCWTPVGVAVVEHGAGEVADVGAVGVHDHDVGVGASGLRAPSDGDLAPVGGVGGAEVLQGAAFGEGELVQARSVGADGVQVGGDLFWAALIGVEQDSPAVGRPVRRVAGP